MVFVLLQDVEAEPAPLNSLFLYQAVFDLYHFHEVHLFSSGREMRVLPDDLRPISEITFALEATHYQLACRQYFKELPEFLPAAAYAFSLSNK